MNKFDVATYNIWCPSYPCNPRIVHTNDRYAKIANLLKHVRIIAIQEITQEAFDEMLYHLNDHWCAFVAHPNRPDGVAIFMNRNEFVNVKVTNIDIPNGDNKSGLLMEAVHKSTQKTVAVATGHFKGGPYPDRAKGDAECQVVGDAINGVDANLKIFAGDFNEVINLYADQNRITKFINAHQFETNVVDQPPYDTEPANRRTIDHILSKAQGAPRSVTVASKNPNIPVTFAGLSDHLPLIKEFTFNPQRAVQPQVVIQQPAQQVFQPQPQPINPVVQANPQRAVQPQVAVQQPAQQQAFQPQPQPINPVGQANPQRAAQPQVAVQQPAQQQVFQPQPQPINPVGQQPEQHSFLTNFARSVRVFFSKQFSFIEQFFTNLFSICRKLLKKAT